MSQVIHNQLTEALQDAITSCLEKHQGITSIDDKRCTLIYQDIFMTIQEIVLRIPQLKQKFSEKGINYIAQAYYDLLELKTPNGSLIEMNPNIFSQRVKPRDMPNDELAFCGILLRGTPMVNEIVSTLKARQ